jgi:hypothetical protein
LFYVSGLLGVQNLKLRIFDCYEFGRWIWSLFSVLLFCHSFSYVSSCYDICNIELEVTLTVHFILDYRTMIFIELKFNKWYPYSFDSFWCFNFHYEWSDNCYAYYRWIVWHPRWSIELLRLCMIIALYMFYGNMGLHQIPPILWNKVIN